MADTTSVGIIQLDVEINPKSLNAEMNKLNKVFNNSFKNMFNGIMSQTNSFVKDSIGKMGNSFKSFTQAGVGSSEKVSKSIGRINNQYEKTQEEIRRVQKELAILDAQRDAIIQKYIDMPPILGLTKEETLEQLLGKDEEFARLGARIEELGMKMAPLKDKSRSLADEIKNAGKQANNTGNNFKKMGDSAKKVGKSIFNLSWLKRMFTNESKKATNATSNFGNTMNRVSRMIARNLIVYGLIIKGLKSMISYMWSALKTNQQFTQSLNIIRTNLLVAFQPIYDFILPALNALMQAVATVTTYIAAAISALFGKTYKQSYNAAKGMNTAIKSMDGAGKAIKGTSKAAKKAGKDVKGALAPFDEINQLMIETSEATPDTGDGGAGGAPGGFEMEVPDLATIDMSGIEKFKEIISKIFEPFKLAWENEGQATIDAIKYALESIKELVKAIGRSWLEVWTNGTGQKVLENILKIIQNIFNIVGSLATAFKNAWNENEVGTRIIQGMFDIFNIILETIKKITGSTAEWAKTLDFSPLLESISKLLESLKPLTQNIGDGLAWLWENALLPIAGWTIEDVLPAFLDMLSGAIRVLNSVIEVLKPLGSWLWDNFLLPLAKWTGGAIVDILYGIAYAFEAIADYIEGIQKVIANSDGFLNALVNVGIYLVKGLFKGILSALAGIGNWLKENLIDPIVNWVKKLFGIASPSTVFVEIGVWLIEGLLQGITNTWTRITDFLNEQLKTLTTLFTETWEGIKDKAEEIWNGIAEFFTGLWKGITTTLTEAWDAIGEFLVGIWEGLSASVTEIWESIKEFLSTLWEGIKTTGETIWNGIKTFLETLWNGIKTIAETTWNAIKNVIIEPTQKAWEGLKQIWDKIKEYVLKKWDEIRTGISNKKNALVNAIKEPFNVAKGFINGIIKDAFNWGKNLIGSFIDGIKSMVGKVKDAASSVAGAVKGFLGFSSPAKEGPGSDADKWMPNMMDMFAKGIEDNVYEVSAAVGMTAGTIQQEMTIDTGDLAMAVGTAVGGAMSQAIQTTSRSSSSGDRDGDIVLKIGETEFGRIAIKAINTEQRRVGKTLLIV